MLDRFVCIYDKQTRFGQPGEPMRKLLSGVSLILRFVLVWRETPKGCTFEQYNNQFKTHHSRVYVYANIVQNDVKIEG